MTRSEWLNHEKRRNEGKLTKSEYCRKIGLKVHAYHYYQKKYRTQTQAPDKSKLAKVIVEPANPARDFSITLELSKQGRLCFYGEAANLSILGQQFLRLAHEKGA